MLTCKQVSNALARQDYASLPGLKRIGLRLHVALCVVCGPYNRQVMIMQDAARNFRKREDAGEHPVAGPALSGPDKERIREALRQAPKKTAENL